MIRYTLIAVFMFVATGCGVPETKYYKLEEEYTRTLKEARQLQAHATRLRADMAETEQRLKKLQSVVQQLEGENTAIEKELNILKAFDISVQKLKADHFSKKIEYDGKVIGAQDDGHTLVISIGTRQGLQKNDTVIVHRHNRYLTKAVISAVKETTAKAVVLESWKVPGIDIPIGASVFVAADTP